MPLPQKIVLLIHSMEMGGAERVAATLANEWAGQGRLVTLLTLTSERADFYSLDPRVARIRLTVSDKRAGNPFAKLANRIRRVTRVRAALNALTPDLVIAFMADCNRVLALARPPGPVVCIGTQHTYAPHTRERWTKTLSKKINYPKLDAVAALTDDMAAYLRKDIGLRHVPTIPNPLLWPIPAGQPPLPTDSVIAPGTKTLLAVGRLIQVKGFDLLITAFARIAGKIPDWNLVIIGEGPERAALENLIETLALRTRVRLPGRAGNMADWYAAADLFVLSSRREGLPMALGEALAAGLPCVAFDCKTGPADLIAAAAGRLVPPEDIVALADAIESLAHDAPLRARLAATGPDILHRMSPAAITRIWDETYARLLSAKA